MSGCSSPGATASVPPTVVAPARPVRLPRRDRAGPSFRADASNRASSASVSPTTSCAVEHADRGRHRAASRTAASDARPTATPSPGGKPCATSVVSSATTPVPSRSASRTSSENADHGIAPSCGAAASGRFETELDAADQEARGERVAGARRVDTSAARAGWSRPSTGTPPAPRFNTQRVCRSSERRALALVREHDVGRDLAHRVRGTRRRPASTSTDRPRPARRARVRARPAATAVVGDRLAEERVAGEVQHVAIEPRVVELARLELGATPRSEAIVRSPADASETTTPVRPAAGPTTSTPRLQQLGGHELAGGVVAALADETRARTELARPRGDVGGLAAGARPGDGRLVVARDERVVELHDHVEQQVAERCDPHD